jgi:hypothetical protein
MQWPRPWLLTVAAYVYISASVSKRKSMDSNKERERKDYWQIRQCLYVCLVYV